MKIIYCDGSSLGNPGPGGFGVVALDMDKKLFWEYGGAQNPATNNQMELAACIYALKLILKSSENSQTNEVKKNSYELKLDSKYVIQGTTEWLPNWVKNNWKNSQKKDVLNKEYWVQILKLMEEIKEKNIKVKWTHVYGHTGVEWNERVDIIAKTFASGQEQVLKKGAKIPN